MKTKNSIDNVKMSFVVELSKKDLEMLDDCIEVACIKIFNSLNDYKKLLCDFLGGEEKNDKK